MIRWTRFLTVTALLVLVVGVGMQTMPVFAQTEEPYAPVIDPANFVEAVDNPYFPLVPGTTMIYEEETENGLERTEVSVLHETRNVLGIPATAVRDTVWIDGELVEDTFDWFAQDRDGNVWYMGEETCEFENGEVVSTAGAWEAGVDGAQPGIIMLAEPQIGVVYRQEYYPGEAEDMAEVVSLSEAADVAYGTFDNVLMTRDWNPLEPGSDEHKYYAPGVGLVLEEAVASGTGRVELVEIITDDSRAEDDDGDPCGDMDEAGDADDNGDEASESESMDADEDTDEAGDVDSDDRSGEYDTNDGANDDGDEASEAEDDN